MKAFHVRSVTFHEEPDSAEPVFLKHSQTIEIPFRMRWTRKGRKQFYRLFFKKTPMKLRRRKP